MSSSPSDSGLIHSASIARTGRAASGSETGDVARLLQPGIDPLRGRINPVAPRRPVQLPDAEQAPRTEGNTDAETDPDADADADAVEGGTPKGRRRKPPGGSRGRYVDDYAGAFAPAATAPSASRAEGHAASSLQSEATESRKARPAGRTAMPAM